MEKVNSFLEKFKNPALWITMVAAIFWISIRLNNVDVIETRLDKKIKVLNEMHDSFDTLKLEMIEKIHDVEIKIKDEEIARLNDKIELINKMYESEKAIQK